MTPEQEKLLVTRAEQLLTAVEELLHQNKAEPQSLRDAITAFRETLPKKEAKPQ